jgi:hypothetical protein
MAEKSKVNSYSPDLDAVGVLGTASGRRFKNDSPFVDELALGGLLGLMRMKSCIVSKSAGIRDRRPLTDDVNDPLTLARARGSMLFLRLAPPRGMMELSTR